MQTSALPYSMLAPYYDLLGWADFTHVLFPHLRRFFASVDSIPSRFLDIGCGTGVLAGILSEMGIAVWGIDIVPEMIEVARSKSYRVQPAFVRGDMCDFDLGDSFPVVGCFYDTVNHLVSDEDLLRAFECAFRHTEPGGYYLFDFNTELGLRNWRPFYSSCQGLYYVTQGGHYDRRTRTGVYRIEAFVMGSDGAVEFISERVSERAYGRRFIRESLAEVGFRRLVFVPFNWGETVAESERLLVICRK